MSGLALKFILSPPKILSNLFFAQHLMVPLCPPDLWLQTSFPLPGFHKIPTNQQPCPSQYLLLLSPHQTIWKSIIFVDCYCLLHVLINVCGLLIVTFSSTIMTGCANCNCSNWYQFRRMREDNTTIIIFCCLLFICCLLPIMALVPSSRLDMYATETAVSADIWRGKSSPIINSFACCCLLFLMLVIFVDLVLSLFFIQDWMCILWGQLQV